MKDKVGYVIVKGESPIGQVVVEFNKNKDITSVGTTGYVYLYPTKHCAEGDLQLLNDNGWDADKMRIRKVIVKELL
jgi:hypothetical protein